MKSLLSFLILLLAVSPIVLFVCLFTLLRRSAKNRLPRQEGASLVFFVAPPARFLVTSALVALVLFTILVLVSSRFDEGSFVVVLIPMSLLVAIFLAKPRPVTLTQNGIRQPRWLRQDHEIAWDEIASMRRGQNSGTTYVRSRNGGRPISFSPLLVGQSRFEWEVRDPGSAM